MIGAGAICFSCARFKAWDPDHPQAYCAAFPDGIPADIVYEGFDHRQPHDDDHGIRFVLDPHRRQALVDYEEAQGA